MPIWKVSARTTCRRSGWRWHGTCRVPCLSHIGRSDASALRLRAGVGLHVCYLRLCNYNAFVYFSVQTVCRFGTQIPIMCLVPYCGHVHTDCASSARRSCVCNQAAGHCYMQSASSVGCHVSCEEFAGWAETKTMGGKERYLVFWYLQVLSCAGPLERGGLAGGARNPPR